MFLLANRLSQQTEPCGPYWASVWRDVLYCQHHGMLSSLQITEEMREEKRRCFTKTNFITTSTAALRTFMTYIDYKNLFILYTKQSSFVQLLFNLSDVWTMTLKQFCLLENNRCNEATESCLFAQQLITKCQRQHGLTDKDLKTRLVFGSMIYSHSN